MFKMTFLKMRTRFALRNNHSLRASIPYDQAKSVGIVFSANDDQVRTDVMDFIRKLEHDGKQIKVLEFLPKKNESTQSSFDSFSKEDLSFWGMIKSDHAKTFSHTAFDLLFCLDLNSEPLVLDVLANSKARCRIGRYSEDERVYFEFMIKQDGTMKSIIDTMYKYVKQIG